MTRKTPKSSGSKTPPLPGGAAAPRPGVKGQPALPGPSVEIDMASEKDRGLVRQMAKDAPRRFRAMDESVQTKIVKGMVEAVDAARRQLREVEKPSEKVATIDALASLTRTAAMIAAIQQKDEHHDDDVRLKEREVQTGEQLVKQYINIDPTKV